MNKKITATDQKAIIELFNEGESFSDIAKKTNFHESTIGNLIKKLKPEHKQSRGSKPKPVYQVSVTGELVKEYQNAKQAGDELGMSQKSIYAKMSAYTPLSNGTYLTMNC